MMGRSTGAGMSGRPAGPGGVGGGPPGGFAGRVPMTVEVTSVGRAVVEDQITIVGSLTGAATVDVSPRATGRLQEIAFRIGDRIARGQTIARVEDREIREQVRQADASFEVARASVRQREADLKFAEVDLERSRSLFTRQLLPRQALDEADARQQIAAAQLDLARAQFEQAEARLEELRINLSNTVVTSPVDGFVARRFLDPGAYVTSNTPILAIVDLRLVRLVANVVEKDLTRVRPGVPAVAEVDAYPGEIFAGRVARVAPILETATRTASIEIEVPNLDFRLRPGMYARTRLTVGRREGVLVVPRNALVDLEGRRGVFVPAGNKARFVAVGTGIQQAERVEITDGVGDGDRVITTGAGALRDGDTIILAGANPARSPGGAGGRRGARPPAASGNGTGAARPPRQSPPPASRSPEP